MIIPYQASPRYENAKVNFKNFYCFPSPETGSVSEPINIIELLILFRVQKEFAEKVWLQDTTIYGNIMENMEPY